MGFVFKRMPFWTSLPGVHGALLLGISIVLRYSCSVWLSIAVACAAVQNLRSRVLSSVDELEINSSGLPQVYRRCPYLVFMYKRKAFSTCRDCRNCVDFYRIFESLSSLFLKNSHLKTFDGSNCAFWSCNSIFNVEIASAFLKRAPP